jgi:hypothetical protein
MIMQLFSRFRTKGYCNQIAPILEGVKPKIADRTRIRIPEHEPFLWNWYRVPGIPGITGSRRNRLGRKNPIGRFGDLTLLAKTGRFVRE